MSAVATETGTVIEISKLRSELNSSSPTERKTAARKVISIMRTGEDIHTLFSDMLRSAKTDDLELKKLVYLFLVNYARQEPEQAIMAVNIFMQDCVHVNPLVRALAVRTMCRINIESVAEYMIVPLKQCLSDSEAYVRKTAALGVSKLYATVPENLESSGIFPILLELLNDENSMVVANTTAAIFEIGEKRGKALFALNSRSMSPILAAIVSCSEWCQVMFLDAVAKYTPESSDDASFLIDRIIPMLKNANPAVVVGAFKCVFLLLEYDGRDPGPVFQQIIPPFITLVMSAESEVQYVVLRTLSLFVQKYPRALSKDIRMFFCKYNDPPFIKLEKLDIMVTICNETTAQVVLDEFSEYCNGVDVEFVRKAVHGVGQIGVKIEAATRRCVDILVSLVEGKAEYAVEEAVIVVADILRRFPGSFESVISTVCQNLEQNLRNPSARAAAIWMLGEYCHIIENVDTLLDPFLDTFVDEEPSVQLQILTAIVKSYVHDSEKAQDQLQFVLNEATKGTVVPDVRSRAFIYWRLLSTDPATSKLAIKLDKKAVSHSGVQFDDAILGELIRNMGSVSGVLHIVPSDFVRNVVQGTIDYDDDFLTVRQWNRVMLKDDPGHYEVWVDWEMTTMHVKIVNKSHDNLTDVAIAVNKNALGLGFATTPSFPASLAPSDSCEIEVPLSFQEARQDLFSSLDVAIAVKTHFGTAMGSTCLSADLFAEIDGRLDTDRFREIFTSQAITGASMSEGDVELADEDILRQRNVFVVGRNGNKSYLSFKLPPNVTFVAEAISESSGVVVNVKTTDPRMLPFLKLSVKQLLMKS